MIIRTVKDKNHPYVIINKKGLQDKSLSWKAKGILAYLLSLPDNFIINYNELMTHSIDGKDSLRSGMEELIKKGYVIRTRMRDSKGQLTEWETIVYEVPDLHTENPLPESENPNLDNPTLINNNNNNNNIIRERIFRNGISAEDEPEFFESSDTLGSEFQKTGSIEKQPEQPSENPNRFTLERDTPLPDHFKELALLIGIQEYFMLQKWHSFKQYWCEDEHFTAYPKDWKPIWEKYCKNSFSVKSPSISAANATSMSKILLPKEEDLNAQILLVEATIEASRESEEIKTIRRQICKRFTAPIYLSWFMDYLIQIIGEQIIFIYPSAFKRDYVEIHFSEKLTSLLKGKKIVIRIE